MEMEYPADPEERRGVVINALIMNNIPFKVSSDDDWTEYATSYNDRLGNPPDVVVLPDIPVDVTNTIKIANKTGAKIQARSGGHSYAAFSSRKSIDYIFIVIDLRRFNLIAMQTPDIVRVGAGVRLGSLAGFLYFNAGRDPIQGASERALAHGTCPSVGVGGHFTHGGYGYTSRAWGLAMDQIIGMEVATPDGRLVFASPRNNPQLFSAMCGAGDSFGIVVYFHLRTHPAPKHVVRFSFEYPGITTDYLACTNAVLALQAIAKQESFTRNMSFNIQLGPGRFGISGAILDSTDSRHSFINRLLGQFGQPSSSKVAVLNWIQFLEDLAGDDPLLTPEPFTQSNNFYANSIMVPEGFNEGLGGYFSYIHTNSPAPVGWFAIIDLWGGHDSQITESIGEKPSVGRRDAFWVVQNYGFVDSTATRFPSSGLEFLKGMRQAMAISVREPGAYANYTDSELTREEAGHLQYGGSYGALRQMKWKLDPNNVFYNAQSI